MFEIYPAIDLFEGKVVRLERGDYERSKVYSERPEEIAERWKKEGARWIHVVDLAAARSGKLEAGGALAGILSVHGLRIQFGGGVRTVESIEKLLKAGVQRVVLGTKALDEAFLKEASGRYGKKLALSLDVRGEEIQTEGWLKGSGKTLEEVFKRLASFTVGALVVTDIEKDGVLQGINLPKMERFLKKSPHPFIVSGGVSTLKDLRELALLEKKLGKGKLDGVIIGKALYEEKIMLKDALQIAREA